MSVCRAVDVLAKTSKALIIIASPLGDPCGKFDDSPRQVWSGKSCAPKVFHKTTARFSCKLARDLVVSRVKRAFRRIRCRGRAKLLIGIGIGKQKGDKRSDIAKRDAKRAIDRAMSRRR